MSSRPLVRATLTVSLLVVTTGHVITRIFVLNFSTTGPNVTALLALTLLTGVVIPLTLRSYSRRRDRALVGIVVAGVCISLVPTPIVSLVGGAAALWALTPLLIVDTGQLRDRIGVAVGIGVLIIGLIRAVTGTTAPHATTLSRGIMIVLTIALVGGSLRPRYADGFDSDADVRFIAPLAAVVLCSAAWLGAPVASARWAGLPYQPMLGLSAMGLTIGVWAVARGTSRSPWWVMVAAGALVLGMGGILAGGLTALAGVVLATASLPVLGGAGGVGRGTPLGVGFGTVCVQTCCLVVLFGFVFAVNAAFAPGGLLLRGTAPAFTLGLTGVVGATAAATVGLTHQGEATIPGTGTDTGVLVDSGRRAALIGVALGTVSLFAAQQRTPRASVDAPDSLRVATYNVHRYVDAAGRYNLESVAELVERHRLGVVGLQETIGTRLTTGHTHGVRWLADRLGYHHAVAPATSAEGYGVALLSAWPIRNTRVVSLPRGNSAPRVALRATVAHPTGALPIVVTHLTTDGPVRTRQAARVRESLTGIDRAVVLGDFNATPTEPPIDVMTDAFSDAWATASTGSDSGATFDATTPSKRIDYVFTRGVSVQAVGVFGTDTASDHRGVSAVIST